MNILHITDIANPEGNGVAVAVENYAKYLSLKANVAIFCLDGNIGDNKVLTYNYSKYDKIENLPKPYSKPDIVVFNEVYKPKYIKLYKECLKNSIPYVIIPHGCLVKGSQNEKKIKKNIGNLLLFNKFIRNACAIQFLNKNEKNNTFLKYKESIISGNGIDFSNISINKPQNNNLIYIGRYSIYIKGLDLLVEICNKNKEWFRNNKVCIELYGRDSLNGLEILRNEISKNNLEDILKLNDAIYSDKKKKILEKSYAFIQISRHEGQPMGIIEALAYGLPCIVTNGTSFGEYVNNNKCGYGSGFNSEEIFKNIKKLYDEKNIRNEMSKNAIECSKKDFDWNNIIDNLIKNYEKIIK